MANLKIPASALSYIQTEVEELADDPEAFGLSLEEEFQHRFFMKYVDMKRGVLLRPPENEVPFLCQFLNDFSNDADHIAYDRRTPKEDKVFYSNASKGLATLASKLSKLPGARSLAPNKSSDARRRGGVRSGEKKSERKDALLFDVEGVDPTLVPLARKWDHKIPVKPKGMSRLEYFLQMVDDDPDAAVQLSEKEAAAYVKGLAKEQHTYRKPGAYQPGEYEDDPYEFVDDFFEGEEPTEEEIETFVQYLEDVLTSREVKMLRRIISKEGLSNREMQCFYRKASGKLQRNGSIWI